MESLKTIYKLFINDLKTLNNKENRELNKMESLKTIYKLWVCQTLKLLFCLFVIGYCSFVFAESPDKSDSRNLRDVHGFLIPTSPDWIKDQVVYRVNLKEFSENGNFYGLEERLGKLSRLGVSCLLIESFFPEDLISGKTETYNQIARGMGSLSGFESLLSQARFLWNESSHRMVS